jgi:hypothetical protein
MGYLNQYIFIIFLGEAVTIDVPVMSAWKLVFI